MAQLQTVFDATKVDPSQGVGQLPVASHLPVAVTESEVKATKDNTGGYIQFTLQVQSGEHAGKRGAYRINLYNSSEAARGIAERQLSALCHVTGVFNLQDTQQIHNIPFMVDVVAQQDPKYTEVKAVYDANGNEPGRAHQQQNTQQNNNGGGQQQQTQQSQPQNQPGAGWGNQNNNQQQQQNAGSNPGWGNQQQTQQQEQPQNNNGGWQQNNNGGGAAPWGQK